MFLLAASNFSQSFLGVSSFRKAKKASVLKAKYLELAKKIASLAL